jgi:hypothetical protein
LKTESADIADLMPRTQEDSLALRITPFYKGDDDENIPSTLTR